MSNSPIVVTDSVERIAAALLTAAEAKDFRIRQHSERVARYSLELAEKLGLDEADRHFLNLGALLHDIGNIGIPDSILLKPTGLSEWEFEEMKMHPLIGAQICKPVPALAGALPLIRSHHEKLDGSGYPDSLRGDAITPAMRILAVVDVYDTLRCDRAYRSAFAHDDAMEILRKEVGKGWWQADIVEIGRAHVADGGEARLQRLSGVGDLHHAPESVAVLQAVVAADLGQAVDVGVHVDQTRQQGRARQVDDLGPGRDRVALLADGRDPAVGDDDQRVVDILPRRHVQQPRGADRRDLGGARREARRARQQPSRQGPRLDPLMRHLWSPPGSGRGR